MTSPSYPWIYRQTIKSHPFNKYSGLRLQHALRAKVSPIQLPDENPIEYQSIYPFNFLEWETF
jgi:hypothetical protein